MADTIQLLSLLDSALGSSSRPQGNNEYLWFCPFCSHHKPKLAVNLQNGQWHCWVCETGGRSLIGLLKKMKAPQSLIQELRDLLHEPIKFEKPAEYDATPILPRGFKPLWTPTRDPEYKHALLYLNKRGIGEADILKYQLGYCTEGEYADRIIIPSYDEHGKLNFWTGRAYRDIMPPYRNPRGSKNIVGFESLISWQSPLVICEGPLDAIAIRRNAVPIFGKTLPPKLLEKIVTRGVRDIYLALDQDALKQAYRIAAHLMEWSRNVYIVQLDDKDPGEVGFEEMARRIRDTKQLTYGDLIKAKVALIRE